MTLYVFWRTLVYPEYFTRRSVHHLQLKYHLPRVSQLETKHSNKRKILLLYFDIKVLFTQYPMYLEQFLFCFNHIAMKKSTLVNDCCFSRQANPIHLQIEICLTMSKKNKTHKCSQTCLNDHLHRTTSGESAKANSHAIVTV